MWIEYKEENDNTKMCLGEIGCDYMEWIYQAHDRDYLWVIVNTVMMLWVSKWGRGDIN